MKRKETAAERDERIGEKVWVFDENRRVYARDAKGKPLGGGPIWREHWSQVEIVGETTRSWILKCGWKMPKVGADPRKYAWSEGAIEAQAWVVENRHRIADMIYRVDANVLRQVAALIGYESSTACERR